MNREIERLLARARQQLNQLGSLPADETHFICPICLSLRPAGLATRGHYPAKGVPGQHWMEVLCAPCNAFMGHAYEADAVKLFAGTKDVTVRSAGTGGLSFPAKVSRASDSLRIDVTGKGDGFQRQFRSIQRNSQRPWEMRFRIVEPDETMGRRALLAWSLMAWFRFAGYRYVASAGAWPVRQLVLDPGLALPETCYVTPNPSIQLGQPKPVILARAEVEPRSLQDIADFLGVGVQWGEAVVVLPFANDANARVWARVAQLRESAMLGQMISVPLRTLFSSGVTEKGLNGDMVIRRTESDARWVVAGDLVSEEIQALVAGTSSRVLLPVRPGR